MVSIQFEGKLNEMQLEDRLNLVIGKILISAPHIQYKGISQFLQHMNGLNDRFEKD